MPFTVDTLNYLKNQGGLSETWQQVRNLGLISLYRVIISTRKLWVPDLKIPISPLKINVEGSFTTQNVPFNELFPMIYKYLTFRAILGHKYPKCHQKSRKADDLPHEGKMVKIKQY